MEKLISIDNFETIKKPIVGGQKSLSPYNKIRDDIRQEDKIIENFRKYRLIQFQMDHFLNIFLTIFENYEKKIVSKKLFYYIYKMKYYRNMIEFKRKEIRFCNIFSVEETFPLYTKYINKCCKIMELKKHHFPEGILNNQVLHSVYGSIRKLNEPTICKDVVLSMIDKLHNPKTCLRCKINHVHLK